MKWAKIQGRKLENFVHFSCKLWQKFGLPRVFLPKGCAIAQHKKLRVKLGPTEKPYGICAAGCHDGATNKHQNTTEGNITTNGNRIY
jgi:hypothetical protein